ncbi:hypothetical protein PP761_gp35 [Stenotrophomonas phage Paxi]|uniref:Uncharacterized protein n=1 Tax=Stenotrophomonas phage Paxi TaxID=2859653 RepID=A0AAE7WLX7_9CAUD|nr:hypothetical protein PP761_gp35 [Stenotrophomonas phage Paxi]QYW01860.1 hypothetical protein CPT_Paxi_094 [Stenotrophomonas phage Paxi]
MLVPYGEPRKGESGSKTSSNSSSLVLLFPCTLRCPSHSLRACSCTTMRNLLGFQSTLPGVGIITTGAGASGVPPSNRTALA